MAKQFDMHEAKSRLSELAELAWQGERIIITKAGKPYLELVPHKGSVKPRVPGRFKGQISIPEDFNSLPVDVIGAYDGPAPPWSI